MIFLIIENQIVEVKWHPKNKAYYENLGYQYTKIGDVFYVKVEDLSPRSKSIVKVECDFCHNIIDVKYQNYQNRGKLSDGYACTNCKSIKAKISIKNKYGVDNLFQCEEVQEKIKRTCLEKYGTEYICQSKHFIEASRNTCLKRYGVPSFTQTEEYKRRTIETNLKNRGYMYHTQDPEVIKKINESFSKNGTCKVSKPQIALFEKLKELFDECYLNYPCDFYSLDCMVKIQDTCFDIEFDGQYWHKNKNQKDFLRDKYVKSKGYKIIRILGNREIPNDDELLKAFDFLINNDNDFIRITTDIK